MPVQINEVIIRAVVDSSANSHASEAPEDNAATGQFSEKELAEKIFAIIKEKKER